MAIREAFGIEVEIGHCLACEFNADRRGFLLRMFPQLKLLYKNLTDLAADQAIDAKSERKRRIPEVDGAIGGFPCTDIASLNSKHGDSGNRSCVASASLRTGGVFRMILKYVSHRRHTFKWLILENVSTLSTLGDDGVSNLDHCVFLLRQLNFEVFMYWNSSTRKPKTSQIMCQHRFIMNQYSSRVPQGSQI